MVEPGKQNPHQSQSIWIFEHTVTSMPWPLKKDFITSFHYKLAIALYITSLASKTNDSGVYLMTVEPPYLFRLLQVCQSLKLITA